jgi:hypothetical protein
LLNASNTLDTIPTFYLRSLVGWFGLQTDRKLALDALNFAATKEDIHSVFAALVLLGYWDLISSLAGWQADEADMISHFETVLKPYDLHNILN